MSDITNNKESPCANCPTKAHLEQQGIDLSRFDHVVALAGNPNTGKSSVFNALTGLRQHTGNWPGKTVTRAEGAFGYGGKRFKLVDLPGTYSLLSGSEDEEVARNFILFGRPDCTVVVTDATALERNLNLVLQVLEVTERVVVCVNLLDEARRKGVSVDLERLAERLGVPVVGTVARRGQGLDRLVQTVSGVIAGEIAVDPVRPDPPPALAAAVGELEAELVRLYPGLPSSRWVAYRLLEGDHRVRQALLTGELGELVAEQAAPAQKQGRLVSLDGGQ